jgi:hypothetical protein
MWPNSRYSLGVPKGPLNFDLVASVGLGLRHHIRHQGMDGTKGA